VLLADRRGVGEEIRRIEGVEARQGVAIDRNPEQMASLLGAQQMPPLQKALSD